MASLPSEAHTQALAEEESAQVQRNAALAHAVKLWRKTHELLEEENAAKERKLRRTVRRHLAGTDAASILAIEPKSDVHKLVGQKAALGAMQTDLARKEEACHYLQLILERLQQQILAEQTEVEATLTPAQLQLLLASPELEGTLAQAQQFQDSDDDDNGSDGGGQPQQVHYN